MLHYQVSGATLTAFATQSPRRDLDYLFSVSSKYKVAQLPTTVNAKVWSSSVKDDKHNPWLNSSSVTGFC